MQATTKDTSKKVKDGRSLNGGARKGSGRKPQGKKYGQYYLPVDVVEKVSKLENPSLFVEQQLVKGLKRLDKL